MKRAQSHDNELLDQQGSGTAQTRPRAFFDRIKSNQKDYTYLRPDPACSQVAEFDLCSIYPALSQSSVFNPAQVLGEL